MTWLKIRLFITNILTFFHNFLLQKVELFVAFVCKWKFYTWSQIFPTLEGGPSLNKYALQARKSVQFLTRAFD